MANVQKWKNVSEILGVCYMPEYIFYMLNFFIQFTLFCFYLHTKEDVKEHLITYLDD